MARRRKGKAKRPREPQVEDVLTGHHPVTLGDLFRLIHRVNPTGQGHSQPEAKRLYEQKSRLQSLLVRQFGEEIIVERGTDEGVVSLVHRSGQFDACHAPLKALDVDARSWVQHQLDIGAAPVDHVSPGSRRPNKPRPEDNDDSSAEDLIRRGRQAMHDFDYEAAEQHLTRALDKGRGTADAALPLLELWVDILGMDREAMETEPRLATETKAHPKVRYHLALATARLGEDERALELARGIENTHAAEVHAALTAQAIRRGEPRAAARYLDLVMEYDSTRPEIPSLSLEIDGLRSERARPAEEKLLERYRLEGAEVVEQDARALLDEWPHSEVARRILRETAAGRREHEIASSLEQAQAALAEERLRDAANYFRKALDAGCERQDLPSLIEQADTMAQQREDEECLRNVLDLLGEEPSSRALLAYLSLAKNLKPRARERVADRAVSYRMLGWLENLGAPSSGSKAHMAVSAVLALKQANESLNRGLAQQTLDVLSPHMRILHHLDDARRCHSEAKSLLARQRLEHARKALEKARALVESKQLEAARQFFDEIDLGELPALERSMADELTTLFRHQETVEFLKREYDHYLETEDCLAALERAEKLARIDSPEIWSQRRAEIQQRIRAVWKIEVSNDPLPLEELKESFPSLLIEGPQVWLDEDHREFLLVNCWERWLFIRVIDVRKSRVVSRVSLRTPEPLGESSPAVCLDGERVRILGNDGYLVELTRGRWDIERWFACPDLLPRQTRLEQELLVAKSPYLWFVTHVPGSNEWKGCVVDTETERVCRRLPGNFAIPIVDADKSFVLTYHFKEGAKLYSPRGTPQRQLRLPPRCQVLSATVSPDGRGLWIVAVREDLDEDDRVEVLEFVPSQDGALELGSRFTVVDAFEDGVQTIVTSLDQGLCFVLVTTHHLTLELLALSAQDPSAAAGEGNPGLRQLYRVPIPRGTIAIQDRRSQHAQAMSQGPGGIKIWPLGPEPPPAGLHPPDSEQQGKGSIPHLRPPFFCELLSGPKSTSVQEISAQMEVSNWKTVYRSYEEAYGHDVDLMVLLCLALKRTVPEDPVWSALASELSRRDPSNPEVALIMAELAAKDEKWEEVGQHLEPVDPEKLEEDPRRHLRHLRGVALLHLDRPVEALSALGEGEDNDHDFCCLSSLIELAKLRSEPPEQAEECTSGQSVVWQVVAAIRAADRALSTGDHETARGALERSAIWEAAELQSAARLAEAYLQAPKTETKDFFRQRLALAFFLDLNKPKHLDTNLDVPGLGWGSPRLDEIAERAQAWLEEGPGVV